MDLYELEITHRGIADLRSDTTTPSCDQEAKRMSREEQDAVYKRPFLGDDPSVVAVVVCVVKERVQR